MMSIIDDYDILKGLTEAVSENENENKEPFPTIDTERFNAYIQSPSDISEDVLYQLVDLVEGKYDINPEKPQIDVSAPKTIDRLLNSQTIIYITEDNIPVGMVNIIDPTIKNFQDIIPLDIYSLQSGTNLNGRLQQEFFSVADEYSDMGIAQELKAQINALDIPTFTVVDETDTKTIKGLAKNGYQFVSTFQPTSNDVPVQLWID